MSPLSVGVEVAVERPFGWHILLYSMYVYQVHVCFHKNKKGKPVLVLGYLHETGLHFTVPFSCHLTDNLQGVVLQNLSSHEFRVTYRRDSTSLLSPTGLSPHSNSITHTMGFLENRFLHVCLSAFRERWTSEPLQLPGLRF